MAEHLSLDQITEYLSGVFDSGKSKELEKHIANCQDCRESLAFVWVTSQCDSFTLNIHELEKTAQCPNDTLLTGCASNLLEKKDHKAVYDHIYACSHCTNRMEELQEDHKLFALLDGKEKEIEAYQEVSPFEKEETANMDTFLYSVYRRIKRAIVGEKDLANYYPSVVEYAVIVVLILITFGCIFGIIKDFSIKEQYARMTGKVTQYHETNANHK
jgi:anti-sigma factor RsiW